MKSLLITPHQYLDADNDYIRIKQPLGLATLKANSSSEISIYDSAATGHSNLIEKNGVLRVGASLEELTKKILEESPDVVGVSALWSSNYPAALETLQHVKKNFPNITTIMGGVHPSFEYKDVLSEKTVDYVAIREATESFPQLIEHLEGKREWTDVSGIVRKNEGLIEISQPTISKKLTEINPIDYRDFPVELYFAQSKFGVLGAINADVVTSLGCPHICDYCSTVQMWPGKYRTYSEEQLDFMFDSIVDAGYTFVSIQDDNLAANPKNARVVMNKLKKRGLNWHWEGGVEIGFLPHILDELCESSCQIVDMAIETAIKTNNGIYDKFRKDIEELLHKELIQMKNSDIFVNSNFMIGNPKESKEDTLRTIEYARNLKKKGLIDHANFHLSMTYPGTALGMTRYEKPKGKQPQDYFGYAAVIGNIPHKDYTRKELIDLRNEADILVNGKEVYEKKRLEKNRY